MSFLLFRISGQDTISISGGKMQLKKNEDEKVEQGIQASDSGDGITTNSNQDSNQNNNQDDISNNGYYNPEQEFNPELEFDYQGGTFGNTATQDYSNDMNSQGSGGYYQNNGNNIDGPANGNYYGQQNDPAGPGMGSRPRKLTKKEFFHSPRNRKDRDRIIISSIVVIVIAIFDIIRTDFWITALDKQINFVNEMSEQLGMTEYIIDTHAIMTTTVIFSVIMICLGLGIYIFKSRACALIGLGVSVVNFVYSLVASHQIRMYWTLIAFGYAVVATISYANAWKYYEEKGDWTKDW